MTSERDLHFMEVALACADEALAHGDVPVGAVVVFEDRVIATGENRREIDSDPTAHAEIVALRRASQEVRNWRLEGATVYVTLEPCVMCAGALLSARVSRVVIGAMDEKAGAVSSRYNLLSDPRLLHETELIIGVRASESAAKLSAFFSTKR